VKENQNIDDDGAGSNAEYRGKIHAALILETAYEQPTEKTFPQILCLSGGISPGIFQGNAP